MVGVERNENIVLLSHKMNVICECYRSEIHIFQRTGRVLRSAEGHLDDTVGMSLGKSRKNAVDRLHVEHVDRGECVMVCIGGVHHFAILFIGCYWHWKTLRIR